MSTDAKIMPPGYEAPFTRQELFNLAKFLNGQAEYLANRALDLEKADPRKAANLRTASDRYGRAAEAADVLGDQVPDQVDPAISEEREQILAEDQEETPDGP